ncbi:hypothetical protein ACFQY4_01545 [Catellatospora bangladeshensis]
MAVQPRHLGRGRPRVRCYLWLETKKMTGSAKGSKGKGIPS